MTTALTEEQRDLAAMVAGTAGRLAPERGTDDPSVWPALVAAELHAIHLPESAGGSGAGLPELTVVVEELGRALVPGPFLPTVLCSAAVGLLELPAGSDLVERFVAGATGALVHDGVPAIGLPGAELVVLRRDDRLFLVEGPQVEVLDASDLTRSAGTLHVGDSALTELGTVSPHEVDLLVSTLHAAEAAGLARWCLETGVAYAQQREQFGRPIGSFQAIQHKAALMLVKSELLAATGWDAARTLGQPEEQAALVAAQAALVVPLAREVALDLVLLLGGIGFTWEHDAHLYWRRALSLASALGGQEDWTRRLGTASLSTTRADALVGLDALPELRARVGTVLDRRPDQSGLAEEGLVAPHYPPPYGLGAGPEQQAVIAQEFAARDLDQPTTVIGEWVLPTVLAHGTPDQVERFVPPTLAGTLVWCQLFSEPGAGSDLASLRTAAVRVDGGWRLTGQKVWNSLAHRADFGVCLARSDPAAPKRQGISYFLVDMRSPGIDVRPLRQPTGRVEFNEVFLDDVFVPDDCVLGEPGTGWALAGTTLANERIQMGSAFSHGSGRLARLLLDTDPDSDAKLRLVGRCVGRELSLSALHRRSAMRAIHGTDTSADASIAKVWNALAQRAGSEDVMSELGPRGLHLVDDAWVPGKDTDFVLDHLGLPSVLLGGGTLEIQLGVLATRVLGLPR